MLIEEDIKQIFDAAFRDLWRVMDIQQNHATIAIAKDITRDWFTSYALATNFPYRSR